MSKNYITLKSFREQFPIFSQKENGDALIYFDSASTAQAPLILVNSMKSYYSSFKANVGRGVYALAEKATFEYEEVRKKVAKLIGAEPHEILFNSGTTKGINFIAQSWAAHNLNAGDEILISEVEHHSNLIPWQELARNKGFILKIIPVTKSGTIDISILKSLLTTKSKLISIVHTSNILGSTNDIALISQYARTVGALVLVDAAQSIAHQQINVKALDCDFLVFSGHKLFGPTGVGILYVREAIAQQMKPVVFGGGMVDSVNEKGNSFRKFPHGFEAGTPNIAGTIAFGSVVDFIQSSIDFDLVKKHETTLVHRLIEALQEIPDIEIISFTPQAEEHAHIVTFISHKYHAHDIAAYLDQYGIAVRAGNHCVQTYHDKLNIAASVRVSFAGYNTIEEVDFLISTLRKLFHL